MSHAHYYGKGNTMVFNRVSDELYVSADRRFEVIKSLGTWMAYVRSGATLAKLGEHNTKRQAIEHCKREA